MKKNNKMIPKEGEEEKIALQLFFRFLKLSNGDDVICQVPIGVETSNHLVVRYPIKVVSLYDPQADESMFAFYPWIPFTNQELIAINKTTIVSITTVRESVQLLYLKHVEQYLKSLPRVNSVADALQTPPTDEMDEDEVPSPPGRKPWLN